MCDQLTCKVQSRIFSDPFCPLPWQRTSSLYRCEANFSTCHSNPDPRKTNSQCCWYGSSKFGNGVLLCIGPRFWDCSTAWQCDSVRDKTCLYAICLCSLLFPQPSKAAWRSGRQKGGKTVEKLNKWAGSKKVLSVGLK